MVDIDPQSLLRLNQLDMSNQDNYNDYSPQDDSDNSNQVPSNYTQNSVNDVSNTIDNSNPQVNSGFSPSTTAQDAYRSFISNPPKPSHHGVLHNIGAAIIGAGLGPQAADQFNNAADERAMSNWLNQGKLLQGAAQDENQTNNINRQLASAQAIEAGREATQKSLDENRQKVNQMTQEKIDETSRNDKSRVDAANSRAALRAQTQKDLENNKGQIRFNDDGTGWMVYNDGSQKQLDLNQFTPEELIKFRADQAIREKQNVPAKTGSAHWTVFQDKDGNMWRVNADSGDILPFKPNTPNNLIHPGTAVQGTTSTSDSTTVTPPELLGSEKLGSIANSMGAGISPTTKDNKTTTITKSAQKAPNAADIPLNQRVAGKTQAMVAGQLMTWNGHGWVK